MDLPLRQKPLYASCMKRSILIVVAIIGCVSIVLGAREWSLLPDHRTHIHFFDVGQGDSALIETPSGKTILIDGGPDWSALEAIGRTLPFFDRSIDVLILTHANLDHLASFPEVLHRYHVGRIFVSVDMVDSPWFRKIIDATKRSGTDVRVVRAGDSIVLERDLVMDILWPAKKIDPALLKELNNTSLVLRIHDNHHSVLFTGDSESLVEDVLLKARIPLESEILKVAHHGSKTSSTDAFLKAVNPKIAVISVGRDNSYGHPNADVIKRLEAVGATVRRTDEGGEVDVEW